MCRQGPGFRAFGGCPTGFGGMTFLYGGREKWTAATGAARWPGWGLSLALLSLRGPQLDSVSPPASREQCLPRPGPQSSLLDSTPPHTHTHTLLSGCW